MCEGIKVNLAKAKVMVSSCVVDSARSISVIDQRGTREYTGQSSLALCKKV